jgi:ribosome-associated protein
MKKTMTSKQLETFILKQLNDTKAQEIVSLNISPLTTVADYMIVCSGTSSRHVGSMADNLVAAAKEKKIIALGVEHDPTGNWTLVDFGDVIVNMMLPKTRELYNLEKLWAPIAPVKTKRKAAASKKTTSKKGVVKKSPKPKTNKTKKTKKA